MQRYFLAPYRADADPIRGAVAHIAELIGAARAAGVPVFYTAQPGPPVAARPGPAHRVLGAGIGAVIDDDPRAEQIIEPLASEPADVQLTKWRYSAFQRSTFADQLAGRGRDQLVITGVDAHIGCQATAVEAFMRDVQPFLVADALADFSRRHHDQVCEYVAQHCGVVTTTAALAAAFTPTLFATG
jgi:bifunctional isochorismate lyase/aryl carrier protein